MPLYFFSGENPASPPTGNELGTSDAVAVLNFKPSPLVVRILAERVASVLSDVPLSVATLRVESWTLIRVLRSAQLRHVSLTWLLSPPLARATNNCPAVIFQLSDSYTCRTIPLEHRLHLMYTTAPSTRPDRLWWFLAISIWWREILA